MRILDSREQKSPQYIFDGIPNVGEMQLDTYDYIDVDNDRGFGAELKHEDFNLKATATLKQFQIELAKMARHHQAHPHIYPHAIWNKPGIWDRKNNFVWIEKYEETRSQIAVFLSMCHDYGVKGHVVESNEQVIKLLLRLKRWAPKAHYMKKSHEVPTVLAKMLHQIDGVSSDTATDVSQVDNFAQAMAVKGLQLKSGKPSKLWEKINDGLVMVKNFYQDRWRKKDILAEDEP